MSKLREFLTTIPRQFQICGALGLLGFVLTFTGGPAWFLGSLLTIGACLYLIGWVHGYRKGGDTVQALYVDGNVAAMEKIVERVSVDYAPDSPERLAAHKQLADLRRMQREISR